MAQQVKNPPAMQERSPGERKWQPTPVFLPEKSHGQEEFGRLQSKGLQRVKHN